MKINLRTCKTLFFVLFISLSRTEKVEEKPTPKFGPKANKVDKPFGPMKYIKMAENLYGIYNKLGKFGKKKGKEGTSLFFCL